MTSAAALPLRSYQTETLDAVEREWKAGVLRPAVVSPTGSGKTVTMSHLALRHHVPGSVSLIGVHREELVTQTIDKLAAIAPGLRVGVVKAERHEVDDVDLIVASMQTLARPARRETLPRLSLVQIDEAHHAAADTWQATLRDLGCFDDVRACGWSATLAREDGRALGDVWQTIAHRIEMLELIRAGHLVNPRGIAVNVEGLDLAAVKTSGGDYQVGDLGDALHDAGAATVAVAAYRRHAAGRSTIVFCPDVASAVEFTAAFAAAGISAETVTGETPRDERRDMYARFDAGTLDVLVSCMVLTEGFDSPRASCAIIARPTTSATLFVQMVGRVLRPFPGKQDALVLLLTGGAGRRTLASLADLSGGTVREVRDGETLTDAVERERPRDTRKGATGVLSHEAFDLFSGSRSAWLQTRAGLWFIPAGEATVFLFPEHGEHEGLFSVGVLRRSGGKPTKTHEHQTLSTGMSWAEAVAAESDPSISSRDASWRRGGRPSEKQVGFARSLRIDVPEKVTKAQLSDLISIALASRSLDRFVR